MVRVLTVDDHSGFRAAAREVIAATPGFETGGEAAEAETALAELERLRPELVLVDVRLPGTSGLELSRRITAAYGNTVVLLISSDSLADAATATRSSGACAFLRKENFNPATLHALWMTHGPGHGAAA